MNASLVTGNDVEYDFVSVDFAVLERVLLGGIRASRAGESNSILFEDEIKWVRLPVGYTFSLTEA